MATIKTIRNQVNKFIKELQDLQNTTGELSLYEINTTIVGDYREVVLPEIQDRPDGGFNLTFDGWTYQIYETYEEEDGEKYYYINDWETGYDSLKESLQFYRRMIRKTLRIWHSENPDAEMEKQDNEE